MKKYAKYILSTLGFFCTYMLMDYLFSKSIDFKVAIGASVMYLIFSLVFFKKEKK